MKIKRFELLFIVLFFSFTFFIPIGKTKAVYHDVKRTTINLSVVNSSDYLVTFNSNGGSSVPDRYISPNQVVGILPIPTKTDNNFAGWYDANNQRVTHETLITSDTTLHAVWTKIVCKRVTDENKLHTETCVSGGCRANNDAGINVNDTITYGSIGDGVPLAGDAYDCDVNYDGTFDDTESDNKTYTERFYFVREKTNSGSSNSAVLVYSTSYDINGRANRTKSKTDIGSYDYETSESYLPSTTTPTQATAWDNPLLVDFGGNGKVSRFVSMDDLESVCGPVVFNSTAYFANCKKWFWFENSRFQSSNLGRAGIWMEHATDDTKYYRIHTQSFDVMEVDETSENMVRPVIEIPMSALEGYYDETRFTLSFNTYSNDPNPIDSVKRYRGEAIGTLPTPVRSQYTFDNWYTDSEYQNVVNPTVLVSENITLYAKWVEEPGVTVTLHLDGGTITGVTSPITVDSGDLLDNLPDPEKTGYNFLGWYTDDEFTNEFDETEPINANLDLYAKWELGNYVAKIGTTPYQTLAAAINAVPTGKVKTRITLLKDVELTSKAMIPNTKYVELDLQNFTLSTSSATLIENSGVLDIINGTYVDTFVSTNAGYVVHNKNGAILNISGGTLIYNNTIAKESKVIQNENGTVNITGGTITCNSQAASINNKGSSGVLNITGGEIYGTNTIKGQGIYIDTGATAYIGGNVVIKNISSSSGKDAARAAIDNAGGTLVITGGTIVSEMYAAVDSRNASSVTTIGINDTGGNTIDTTTPVLYGKVGAVNNDGGTINVYDGVYKVEGTNVTSSVLNQTYSVTIPSGTEFAYTNDETYDGRTYHVYYLKYTSGGPYTVTFNPDNGTSTLQVTELQALDTVNTRMPNNPTKANYIFEKWFVYKEKDNEIIYDGEFTSTTPVTDNITVKAKWKPTINVATITPSSISMEKGNTTTINVTGPDELEAYTFSSSNTNVATVDTNGLVTAVGEGSATITITGIESNNTRTVSVTVSGTTYHTVTFYDILNGNVIKTTQVADGTQIGASGMPSSNPTKQNYVFDNWYVNGNTSAPPFNSTAIITDDVTVVANWLESVDYATLNISPDPMNLNINGTGTISLNPTVTGDTVESYTCSSNDTNVATVNNCIVTARGVGNTTITIEGSDPLNTKTVNVTVTSVKYTITFDKNNGEQDAVVTINNVESGTLLSTIIPTDPSKTDYIFDNWYLVENSTWTDNAIDPTMAVTSNFEFRAGFYTSDDVAAIGHTYYTTYKAAIDAVPTTKVETEVRLLKDAVVTGFTSDRGKIESTQNVYLNGNGHTLSCTGTKKGNTIWNNGGTITLKDVIVTCDGIEAAPIDSTGKVVIIDSSVIANLSGTDGRAAVYNGTNGRVTIKGNSYLSTIAKDRSTVQNANASSVIDIQGGTIVQAASDSTKYAVEVYSGSKATISGGTIRSVHNHAVYNAGILTITGGSITSDDSAGVYNTSENLTIGNKNNEYDVNSPIIQGETYGINSTANYSLYDGIIKGKTNNKAVNDFSKINNFEDNFERQTGTDGNYYTLYYTSASVSTPPPTPAVTHTITFQSIGGTITPSTVTIVSGNPITSADLPTATWGNKTLAGWYLDEEYTNALIVGTTIPTEDTTYYAKWTYTDTLVNFDSTNDAMSTYFSNISTWKNLSESAFESEMLTNFNNNSCSNCNEANNCNSPSSGTQCDKPKIYDTNTNSALNVYLFDEANNVIKSKIEYANSSSGTISNLIPGQAYYWEKVSDPTVNGLVKFTTPRRNLDVGNVRNVRDLGGLSVSYTENNTQKTGTIKYGKILRGAKLSSSQDDVTNLTNLGITREIDLRPDSEGSGQARLPVLDNGSGGSDIIIQNYLINHMSYTYSYTDRYNGEHTEVAANITNAQNLKAAIKSTMQYIVNGDNVYLHCTIGADRTGTIAYFLEGLLGVSEEDRLEDYELTYFFGLTNRTRYHDHLNDSDINPRFKFMHTAYQTNQDIYNWYVNVSPSSDDLTLLEAFREAMIDVN